MVMTPKPLSAERRAEIERAFSGTPNSGTDARLAYAVETIQELLSAEAYWREAVKEGIELCEKELKRGKP